MINPVAPPNYWIDKYLSLSEFDAVKKLLLSYQKSRSEWDVFRRKIPSELLEKWKLVMDNCRENGYIAPKIIHGDELIWSQILGFKRNFGNANRCSVCSATFFSGVCKGKSKYKQEHYMFVPCWE